MSTLFDQSGPNNVSPASYFAAVTPSDTVNLPRMPRALYVGTGGDVVAIRDDGTAVTFKNVADGQILPVRCIRVNSTGTTASNIVWMD